MNADLPPVPIHDRLGIEIIAARRRTKCAGTIPVAGNEQPFGALHGGASVVLAESLASIGSALHAGPDLASSASRSAPATTQRAIRAVSRMCRPPASRAVDWPPGRSSCAMRRALTCTARVTCLILDSVGRRRRRRSARSSSLESRFVSADVAIARRMTNGLKPNLAKNRLLSRAAGKHSYRHVVSSNVSGELPPRPTRSPVRPRDDAGRRARA